MANTTRVKKVWIGRVIRRFILVFINVLGNTTNHVGLAGDHKIIQPTAGIFQPLVRNQVENHSLKKSYRWLKL